MLRRKLIALAPALLPLGLATSVHAATAPFSTNHKDGVALAGLDPVAWFTEGRPRRGTPAYATGFAGVTWHFASADHLARFRADPAAHAPRFGGFCAFGVARGYKVDIDPEAWHIEAGALYLNYDRGVQRQWRRDIPGYVARAEANWPRIADV